MSVLSAEKVTHLSLGISILADIFPGFEIRDFAVLGGDAVFFIAFVLSVRRQMSVKRGELDSSVVFVDGGNSFGPEERVLASQLLRPNTRYDVEEYLRMLVSSAETLFEVLGYSVDDIRSQVLNSEKQVTLHNSMKQIAHQSR